MAVIKLFQGQQKLYPMDGPDMLRVKLELPDAAARVAAARGLLTMLDRAA
jgi:transcription-repair coupling factor (superfamily II helicase)